MNNTDVERWFEGLPLSAAEFFRICDKCKYAIRINGGRHEYHYLGKCKPEAAEPPSLSLLVVDFGSHCVFKVESPDESVILYDYPCDAGRICVVSEPFEDVKAAIGQPEDKPPVPRIERGHDEVGGFILHWESQEQGCWKVLSLEHLDALSELAGKPLPIYEPKRGTWERLDGDCPKDSFPCKIWRFTR